MSVRIDVSGFCLVNSCVLFLNAATVVVAILLFSIIFLYPFYVMSFRRNRDRDETTNSSIFYILKHFYHVVNFMELCFIVDLFCIIFMWMGYATLYPTAFLFVAAILFISLIIIITVTAMENILLSALAIHRFLLYFFPRSEKFLSASLKTMILTMKLLYITLFIVNFIDRFIKVVMIAGTLAKTGNITYVGNSEMDLFDTVNQRVYFGLTIFLFFSASLYIPMMISIGRLMKLQSVKKSHPERYILYQTLFLVLFRSLYIPILYFMCASLSQFNETILFAGMVLVDVCVTHFIIQASYLSCNKKHVESILSMCSPKKVSDMDSDQTTDTVHSSAATNTVSRTASRRGSI